MSFIFERAQVLEISDETDKDEFVGKADCIDRFLEELQSAYESSVSERLDLHDLPYLTRQLANNSYDSIIVRQADEDESYTGRVDVMVKVSDGRLRVEVEDNGIGIHQAIEPYLFTFSPPHPEELLEKRKKLKGRLFEGRGLGLKQVKDDIEKLDGQVGYKNKGEAKGAVFWYECPLESL